MWYNCCVNVVQLLVGPASLTHNAQYSSSIMDNCIDFDNTIKSIDLIELEYIVFPVQVLIEY